MTDHFQLAFACMHFSKLSNTQTLTQRHTQAQWDSGRAFSVRCSPSILGLVGTCCSSSTRSMQLKDPILLMPLLLSPLPAIWAASLHNTQHFIFLHKERGSKKNNLEKQKHKPAVKVTDFHWESIAYRWQAVTLCVNVYVCSYEDICLLETPTPYPLWSLHV